MHRLLILSLVLLLAVACAKAPPVTEPEIDVEVPQHWSVEGASDLEVNGEWWTTFEDQRLDDLIELALERNWDLQAALARVDRAEAQARIAGADLKPSIDAGLNAGRSRPTSRDSPAAAVPLSTATTPR